MISSTPLHIAVVVHLGWGHVRPMCALVAKLVRLRDADVTFMTTCQMFDKTVEEIARNFEHGEDALQSRIRVIGLQIDETNMFDEEVVGKSFEDQLQKLQDAQPAYCSAKQTNIPALKAPDALIVDALGYQFFQIARRNAPGLKIIASLPSALFVLYDLIGLHGPDSQPMLKKKIDDIAQKTGKTVREVAGEVVGVPSEELKQVPGLPPIYDYENYTQQPILSSPAIGYLHYTISIIVQEADGLMSASMAHFEPPEILEAFDKFLSVRSCALHLLGPLLPETRREAEVERMELSKSPEIASFMENVLQKHGRRSMVYVSFGTVFWTTQPDMVWTFLDVLMDRNIPFIMAQASPFCQFPEEVAAKVKASGIGLITPWAPQQAILEHPATGWFLTHAGFNSIIESIHAGIPMICWPFTGDQPMNTIHLTENLDVAYELFEVRTGTSGLKPAYRTGKVPVGTLEAVRSEAHAVLEQAFGTDGARKRENIRKLREVALTLWNDGGAAQVAAKRLLEYISS